MNSIVVSVVKFEMPQVKAPGVHWHQDEYIVTSETRTMCYVILNIIL